jgi:hypothetical protein
MAISFSQIDRIVKPRVGLRRRADRADQRADLTISKNKEKEKGTTNLWMQSHDSSPDHQVAKFTRVSLTDSIGP